MNSKLEVKSLQAAATPLERAQIIQRLIDSIASNGSGMVSIPPGRWIITTLFLRNGTTLMLERGAILEACTDLALYPTLVSGHNKDRQPYHLILAENCEGITLEGDGVIDGQGMAFWNEPAEGSRWYREKQSRISPLLEIRNCRNVVLRDFTIKNSPGWTIHLNMCDRVTLRGVTLENHVYGPNTDGFDINGCRDVFVSDCNLRCGDDAIIIKATHDTRSSERITVTNCILQSNCAALGLGAETHHDIRNVTFSNCVVKSALRMIQIEMWEAGTIENIVYSNIAGQNMTEIPLERPIYLDVQQHRRPEPILGKLRNVVISNFVATTRGRIMLTAQDGAMIEDVTLRDVQLYYPEIEDAQLTVPASRSNQMSNYNPHSRAVRSAMIADNVRRMQVHNLSTRWLQGEKAVVPMHGLWCRNVKESIVDAPFLCSSRPEVERIKLMDSELKIRA